MDTRRQFLARSSAAAAAAVLAPQDALAAKRRQKRPQDMLRGGRFSQGVLSGDPAPDAITLLTIVDDAGGAGRVRLEVARDPDFRRVVARRDILTTPAIDHSVKARVTGLKPHQRYYYRFETRDRHSPVGRFQTALPPDSRETVRFGFFSCADFTHGYYNAYAALAREDVDFVVSLGDYIYAETYSEVGDGRAVRDDRIGRSNPYYRSPLREAATLPEYRAKYALYRSDASLRQLHATFPMVATWDDHEVLNNYANDAEDGGLPLRRRFSRARRDAAYQAWFEAMPVFSRARSQIYRTQSLRADDRADHARRAPVPRQPAVRRLARVPVQLLGPAAHDPRPPAARVPRGAAEGVAGRVEGRRRPVADHAQPRPRRAVRALRLLAGLPAGARAPAQPHREQRDQGRRLRLRRRAHVRRRRRLHADGRRARRSPSSSRPARSRRRTSARRTTGCPAASSSPAATRTRTRRPASSSTTAR